MFHVLAIAWFGGLHVAVVHQVTTWIASGRSLVDIELAAEVRLVELVDGEERNEDTVSHVLAEALVTMEHLAHTVGG